MSEPRTAQLKNAEPRDVRRIAIIVAMKREIDPLLELWRYEGRTVERRSISVLEGYVSEGTWVIVAGIGRKRAAVAARVVVEYYQPELMISAGVAGALSKKLRAGDVVRPQAVVDAASGEKYNCVGEREVQGVLVTAASVVSRKEKEELAEKFKADSVDMEAAVVGQVAHASGIPFMAVKAISDELDFEMPPLGRFVDSDGQVHLLQLLGYAALRPQIWGALGELRRNSRVAAEKLGVELELVIGG
jgi:adenosylhomocysteine nucleosidase